MRRQFHDWLWQRVNTSRRAGGVVLLLGLLCLAPGHAFAAQTNLQLRVVPIECSVDATYNSQQGSYDYVLTPADCARAPLNAIVRSAAEPLVSRDSINKQPAAAVTPIRNTTSEAGSAPSSNERPGDQLIFEDSVMEPLAAWTGVGNPSAPASRPLVGGAILAVGGLLSADIIVLRLRASKSIMRRVVRKQPR